jgi:4'-phosphopantetheinyl transferase
VDERLWIRVVQRSNADPRAAAELLTVAERDDFARDRILPRRELRLIARAALREWLGVVLNQAASAVPLVRLPSGRLELTTPPGGWSFSVATRGDVALLALGQAEAGTVGVDIESLDGEIAADMLDAPAIIERERHQLDALPHPARARAALRLWVRKEAVAKALGIGVAAFDAGLDLSTLAMEETPHWQSFTTLGRTGRVRDLTVPVGYAAALAVVAPPES